MRSSSAAALIIAIASVACSGTVSADQNDRVASTEALELASVLFVEKSLPSDFPGEIDDEPTQLDLRALRGKKTKKKKKKKSREVRIKLYWEKGYEWQGRKYDRKFCMEKVSGNKIEVHKCSSKNRDQRWVVNGKTIRTASGNRCITKTGGQTIDLESCDGSSSQEWDGFKKNGRFELHPAGRGGKICVTQHHHPSPGEEVKMMVCDLARRHDTSYWRVY